MSGQVEKLLLGALAGFAATLPMTMAMRRLHQRLPSAEQYPLPPREIAEDLPSLGMDRPAAAMLHHFLYGAAAGGAFGLASRRRDPGSGAVFGIAVWIGSYLGWIPAARILRFGTRHPARRNGLMLASHLVWGACLAAGLRELELARQDGFTRSGGADGRLKDRPEEAA